MCLLRGGVVRTPLAARDTHGYGRHRPRVSSNLRLPRSTHNQNLRGSSTLKLFRIAIAAMLLGLAPETIVAQEFRASISGEVTDPTGAAVEGARVVALSLDRNVPYETTTNVAGRYIVKYL